MVCKESKRHLNLFFKPTNQSIDRLIDPLLDQSINRQVKYQTLNLIIDLFLK